MDSTVLFSNESKTDDDCRNLEDILLSIGSFTEEIFYMKQSIEVAERFLRRKSPHLFTSLGLDSGDTHISMYSDKSTDTSKQYASSSIISKLLDESKLSSGTTSTIKDRTISIGSSPRHTITVLAPFRINTVCKLTLVDRDMEEGNVTIQKLRKRFASAMFLLNAEEENFRAELDEIEKRRGVLDTAITDGIDKRSGYVLRDKFERFLENEIETRDREWRKMRLKVKQLGFDYSRMKAQQSRKLELREHLHAIDLDRLFIENQEKQDLLNQKTKELHNLKKEINRKGLNIITLKSNLNNAIINFAYTTNVIKHKNAKIAVLGTMEERNSNRIRVAEDTLNYIKKIRANFKSPDVQSYIELEVAVATLKKERDNWEKLCFNDNQTITFLNQEMRKRKAMKLPSPKLGYLSNLKHHALIPNL